jgi:hypothetical protein
MFKKNARGNKLGGTIRRKIIPVALLALCLVFAFPVALANSNNSNNSGPSISANWHAWHENIRHQPTPGTGCFEAKYPNAVWQRLSALLHPHFVKHHLSRRSQQVARLWAMITIT